MRIPEDTGLLNGHGLDFKERALGQSGHLYAGAGGGLAGEILGIDGVDGGKVVDVRQEHGGLDHVGAARR